MLLIYAGPSINTCINAYECVKDNDAFQNKERFFSLNKKEVSFVGDEIQDLSERLIGIQQAKDTEKDQYEQQLQQIRNEFQETKDQLTSENMILGKLI